jgi:hypothetical protein
MNPLSINPLALLAGAALALVLGFGSGWQVNGWRLGAEIADLKGDYANEKKDQAESALVDFKEESKKIRAAADDFMAVQSSLDKKVNDIRKDLKHVQATSPLPADCLPDAGRMRILEDAVKAAREAATR